MMRKIGKKVVVVFGGLVASVLVMFGTVSEVKADAAIPDIGLVINDTRFQSDDVVDYSDENTYSLDAGRGEYILNNDIPANCLESVCYAYVHEGTPETGDLFVEINGKKFLRCEKKSDATAVIVFIKFNPGDYKAHDSEAGWGSETPGKHYAVYAGDAFHKIYEIDNEISASFDVDSPQGDSCDSIPVYIKDKNHRYLANHYPFFAFKRTTFGSGFFAKGYGAFIPLAKGEKKSEFKNPVITKKAETNKPEEIPDRDTYKSEAPSKTVIASDEIGAKSFLDLKVHAADARSIANQEFLAQSLIGSDVKILLTENVYPRRDLSVTEDGSVKFLIRNNLPKNQAGDAYAVVYNQKDGAYVINGTLDANGTATFSGFKLRSASTITICK